MPARKTAKSEPFTPWWSRLKLSDGRTVRYIGLTKIKGMIWVENLKTGGEPEDRWAVQHHAGERD